MCLLVPEFDESFHVGSREPLLYMNPNWKFIRFSPSSPLFKPSLSYTTQAFMLLFVSPETCNCQATVAGIVQIVRCMKSNPGDYSHNIVKNLFLW